MEEVVGSIPTRSTNSFDYLQILFRAWRRMVAERFDRTRPTVSGGYSRPGSVKAFCHHAAPSSKEYLQVVERIGGPGRDRTDDLFHAMEARSQLRHRPTWLKGEIFPKLI